MCAFARRRVLGLLPPWLGLDVRDSPGALRARGPQAMPRLDEHKRVGCDDGDGGGGGGGHWSASAPGTVLYGQRYEGRTAMQYGSSGLTGVPPCNTTAVPPCSTDPVLYGQRYDGRTAVQYGSPPRNRQSRDSTSRVCGVLGVCLGGWEGGWVDGVG